MTEPNEFNGKIIEEFRANGGKKTQRQIPVVILEPVR